VPVSEQIATGAVSIPSQGRMRLVHAEDPRRPGVALCGARLRRGASPAASGQRCAVCLDLTQSFLRS
jgi:hypothetical protein